MITCFFSVECPYCGKKLWADVGITCERRVYSSSPLELEEYILKYAIAYETYTDEEIAYWVKRTIASMIKMNRFSKEQIIKDVSKLYGIPEIYIEEIYDEVVFEIANSLG